FANVYTGAPSLVFIISYYIILIAVFKFKRNLYKLFGLAFLLIFVFFSYKILQSNGKLTVTFLDVGLGDSVFVKTPDNKKIFVDCGGADAGVGKWVYQPFLLSQGITKIDKILITTDKWTHYAGLKGLIEFFKIGEIYLPKQTKENYELDQLIKLAKDKGIVVKTIDQWENVSGIEVLKPFNGIIKVSNGNFSMLLTSDTEENVILKNSGHIGKVNVLQVPQHGKKMPSKQLLNQLNPEALIVSSDKSIANVYSTAASGAIEIVSDGKKYKVSGFLKQ
ncbi:MAG: MBL fold metallo-hydrolase, partial [Elusimicrobia bacterium]|nr:MBL fold metallo-hydrolase [Elusimicrobiota bacterium]